MTKVVYTGTRAPEPVDGVEIAHLPMLETVGVALPDRLAEDVQRAESAHAVFYSQHAADWVIDSIGEQAFRGVTMWAVGARTAARLEERLGCEVRAPAREDYAGLTEALGPVVDGGCTVFSFELHGSERRLEDARLRASVRSIPCYESVPTHWDDLDGLLRRIAPRWVIFASPRAFAVFRENLHHRVIGDSYRVAALGGTTRDAIAHAGDRVDYVPTRPDVKVLLEELLENG